jgi:hypothetical protein
MTLVNVITVKHLCPLSPKKKAIHILSLKRGDRLDLLAYEFYQDVSLWWILAAANPIPTRRDSYVVEPGHQFRIPANPQAAIRQYYELNNNR